MTLVPHFEPEAAALLGKLVSVEGRQLQERLLRTLACDLLLTRFCFAAVLAAARVLRTGRWMSQGASHTKRS